MENETKEDSKLELGGKKTFLNSYKQAVIAETLIEEEIEQLRLSRLCPSAILDGMPHVSKHNDLSSYVEKVDELLDELRHNMETRIELRQDIIRKIEQMEDETEKTVLRMKYIHDRGFEEIAERTGYCGRHIQRIYKKALTHFSMS